MRPLFFAILGLFNFSLSAQELDPNKFFPSSVGNIWEYSYSNGLHRFEIVADSLLLDSSKYIYYDLKNDPVYRIDKNHNVFWIPKDSILNWLYYKLDADSGDHWMVRPETPDIQRMEALVRNKYPSISLGRETIVMEITYYDLSWGDTVINEYAWPRFTSTLAYGIGEIMEFDEEGGGPQRVLQGCIIDGDTLGFITSVDKDYISLNSFELYQNYPNPFNPTTTIRFSLSEPQKVKLTVYSLLGEEIKVLLDDFKPAGNHSVIINASDLASGVYIYTLVAGQQSASKKLMLLK